MEKSKAIKQIETEGIPQILKMAESLVIKSVEDMKKATEIIVFADNSIGNIDIELDPLVSAANKTHKNLTAFRSKLKHPFIHAKQTANEKQDEFYAELKRKEIEDERKAEAAAQLKEERKKEELRKRAEAAAEKGDNLKAESLTNQAEQHFEVPKSVQTVEKKIESESGVSHKNRDIEIRTNDPRKVLTAILEGVFPISCVKFIESELKKQISGFDQHDDIRKIPVCYREGSGLTITRTWKTIIKKK